MIQFIRDNDFCKNKGYGTKAHIEGTKKQGICVSIEEHLIRNTIKNKKSIYNMKKNNRETGAKAEAIACWFLKQQGYDVLEQNFYTKVGEIDIIAKEDQTLVFVEVKYRKDDKKGYPAQAVDQRKQQKIRKSAMIYLKKNHLSFEQPIRFDVVEILGKKIRVIKHAF